MKITLSRHEIEEILSSLPEEEILDIGNIEIITDQGNLTFENPEFNYTNNEVCITQVETINNVSSQNIRDFLISGDSTLVVSALTVIKNAGLSNEKKKDFLKPIYSFLRAICEDTSYQIEKIKYNFYHEGKGFDTEELTLLMAKSDDYYNKYKIFVEGLTGKPNHLVREKEIYFSMRNL
ncbi:hypothetical protein AD998_01845 [bacterium 336/3]|nr:hypothetical protein AD998_01845 [bacterium 336/3]